MLFEVDFKILKSFEYHHRIFWLCKLISTILILIFLIIEFCGIQLFGFEKCHGLLNHSSVGGSVLWIFQVSTKWCQFILFGNRFMYTFWFNQIFLICDYFRSTFLIYYQTPLRSYLYFEIQVSLVSDFK